MTLEGRATINLILYILHGYSIGKWKCNLLELDYRIYLYI